MFLWEKCERGHFRLHGRCWRSADACRSVHEDHGTRGTGRARVGARSSNFEGRGTALETAEQQQREATRAAGAAPLLQTNRGSTARHRAHARARLQCSQKSGAPRTSTANQHIK